MRLKSSKKGLYSAYKYKAQAERNGKQAGSEVKIQDVSGREDICVFSLSHGTGTSYISAAIANYLSSYCKGRVSLVLNDIEFADEIVNARVNVASWENETDVFAGANYIVHDIGVYDELAPGRRETLQRGTTKILVCKGDGASLTKLAEYVEREEPEDIIYLFNQLPREWEKRAFDLIDFTRHVYCLPTFFSSSPNDGVVKIFGEMLK